nr:threonine synthase [Candidatus Njordarchaeum guaymaensis]
VEYDYGAAKSKLNKATLEGRRGSLWKYRELLPVFDESFIVSLEEGNTPLHRAERLGASIGAKRLYLKNETRNPTWSFKDRVYTVLLSKARELGFKVVALASSGNAAASASAYSAKAKLPCYIFVQETTSTAKMTQMLMHKANVIKCKGGLVEIGSVATEACMQFGWFHITPTKSQQPYSSDGAKTVAYEIAEQLGWKVPDNIVVPVGGGDLLGGIWKGFKDLKEMGLTYGLPRMVVSQPEGANPVVKGLKEKKKYYEVRPFEPHTIAAGIKLGIVPGSWVLNALNESHGEGEAVSDDEIIQAEKLMAREEALFAEPSSAAPIATLKKLIDQGRIGRYENSVCIVTGAGLKDIDPLAQYLESPPVIRPDIRALKTLLEQQK